MEFRFPVNEIFRQPVVKIGSNLLPPGFTGDRRAFWDVVGKVSEVVNAMGESSASAQGLTKPITTAERLRNSEHTVYLLIDQNAANGRGAVTGMLKTGKKGLYVFDRNGQHFKVSPPCVLDFYVHESRQRMGLGKRLFEHMLQEENIEPVKMAIDRPSEKFLGFLNKHYSLNSPVKQMNNYVVFDGFFPSTPERNGAVEVDHSSSIPGRKQSANGLQTTNYASPLGRYGAPRPPCSMGQIIHNQTSTIPSNTEPTGVEGARSLPETNYQVASNHGPGHLNFTQSTPNMSIQPKKKLDGLDQYSNQTHYTMEEISRHFQQPNQREMYGYSEEDSKTQGVMSNQPIVGVINQQPKTTNYEQSAQNSQKQNIVYPENTQIIPQNLNPGQTQNYQKYTQQSSMQNAQPYQEHYVADNAQFVHQAQMQGSVSQAQEAQYMTPINPSVVQSTPQMTNVGHHQTASQMEVTSASQGYLQGSVPQAQGAQYMKLQNPSIVQNTPQITNVGHNQTASQIAATSASQGYLQGSVPQAQGAQYMKLQDPSIVQNTPQITNVGHYQTPSQMAITSGHPELPSQMSVTNQQFTPYAPETHYKPTENLNYTQQYAPPLQPNIPNSQYMYHVPQQQNNQSQPTITYNLQVADPKVTAPQYSQSPVQYENSNVQSPTHNTQSLVNANVNSQNSQKLEQNISNTSQYNMPISGQRISRTNMTLTNPPNAPFVDLSTSQQALNQAAGDFPQNMSQRISRQNVSQGMENQNYRFNQQTNLNSQNIPQANYAPQQTPQYQNNSPQYVQGSTSIVNAQNEQQLVQNMQGVKRAEELASIQYGYPSQIPEPEIQVKEEQVNTSPKLERPRSLSIQLSEEQTEDKKNDVESEVPPNETEIEEVTIEKLSISENEANLEQQTDKVPTPEPESKTPGKRTPSHLTEQGFFDLKFYHNKLW